MPDHRLTMAALHLREGRRILQRRSQIIADRKAHGVDTSDAEDMLAAFERTLTIFDRDLAEISEWAVFAGRSVQ